MSQLSSFRVSLHVEQCSSKVKKKINFYKNVMNTKQVKHSKKSCTDSINLSKSSGFQNSGSSKCSLNGIKRLRIEKMKLPNLNNSFQICDIIRFVN